MNKMNGLRSILMKIVLALIVSLSWMPVFAADPVLHVAAAADLAPCMDELNAAFIKYSGPADIKVSIGSSGGFFAQIKNGAPFDVFLSADMTYPLALVKDGLADMATLRAYAHGRLVLWTSDPQINVDSGLRVLLDPAVRRFSIANPDVAPYGRAAKAALEQAGLWQTVAPKLVRGENVMQAAQFVETGNVQVGLISLAHAKSVQQRIKGRMWQLPPDSYPLLEQGAIVTTKGQKNALAAGYLEFLRSEPARAVLRKYGFVIPETVTP